ncbi:MAG TPA: methylated-DNA--[protein]-cysteine S-methyltransferase, partial [Longimicrobium sp.]|nr:methylated-DNA--[protein]-cysteine S-methyltransferase [Longimicrobium sp.]
AHVAESALVKAYFAGDVHALEVLPIDPAGTPFQRAVWALVRQIPAGETRSYRDLAARLGSSARAVGGANAANPIALAVPCHRVVAADGTLRGYAWGLERKEWLLRHERAAISAAAPAAAAG